jgi:molecular chaperone DnaK
MSKMVNFGVDLGTTNSLIAKFEKGNVEIFKNPNGFKETLPSIVGFRNDAILVGDKARTYAERDPKSVISRFKRKMGTTETMKIASLNTSKSPIELSAEVLKELKNFIHSGEKTDSIVITIPASFDTVQSNATKEAGELAGFKNVILLQEPIAASLAYANKEKNIDLRNSQWIVYDFGGGTFDVALVKIVEGELTVVDHEGDNYLGGTDFDARIVEELITTQLEKLGNFSDLVNQMKSEAGKYNRLWPILLHKAEEAKIELSTKSSSEIDLGTIRNLEDDDGKTIDSIITITRSEFEAIIKEQIDETAEMMKKILTRNSLQSSDIEFILMVGGSTYIPYVRKRIEELMNVSVNTSIDPTNAIVVGAAYFAGTKEIKSSKADKSSSSVTGNVKAKVTYNRNSHESAEIFQARLEGDLKDLFYRINRDDGAYDSGLKKLSSRIVEDLPLREGEFNSFTFKVLDAQNNSIDIGFDSIQITQGKYSVAGQLLPEDLCLVLDDIAKKDTKLEPLFSKNSIIPAKTKKTQLVGKTVIKGTDDEIRIMVVEGSSEHHSSTNKPIGVLLISGKQITKDLLKGTDVDLTFEISESRDLTVSAYLNGTSQEFSQVFEPKPRAVPVRMLATEILALEAKLEEEQRDAENNNNNEASDKLGNLLSQVQDLIRTAGTLSDDDVTDDRFKLEDKKRKIAQEMYSATSGKRLDIAKVTYQETKREVAQFINENGNDREKHMFTEIISREQVFLKSTNPERIQSEIDALEAINFQILGRDPKFLVGMFGHLNDKRISMNDQVQAKQLCENGKRLIEQESWDDLRIVNSRLWELMPTKEKDSEEMRHFTGII